MDLIQGHMVQSLTTLFILFIAIFLRYLILAGLFYYFVQIKNSEKFKANKISLRPPKINQIRNEILYSMISSFLFAVIGTIILNSWAKGETAVYTDWHLYPWYWPLLSLFLILFIHETYYYWLHRWMHYPVIFKLIHRTHHESLSASAWTSFSFHPIESLLQAMPIFLMIYWIPIHLSVLILFLVIMAITSVINHLNHELYPSGSHRHWLGKWWIGATHHQLHHVEFKTNFGLYFTCWDHWMNTESCNYHTLFEEKTKKIDEDRD